MRVWGTAQRTASSLSVGPADKTRAFRDGEIAGPGAGAGQACRQTSPSERVYHHQPCDRTWRRTQQGWLSIHATLHLALREAHDRHGPDPISVSMTARCRMCLNDPGLTPRLRPEEYLVKVRSGWKSSHRSTGRIAHPVPGSAGRHARATGIGNEKQTGAGTALSAIERRSCRSLVVGGDSVDGITERAYAGGHGCVEH